MIVIRYHNANEFGDLHRGSAGASGFDLRSRVELHLDPGCRVTVPTGIRLEMPLGVEAQVRPRSGLVRDRGVVAADGTIDSDYRGEVSITLFNHGEHAFAALPGERVAQLVFAPVLVPGAEWLLLDQLAYPRPVIVQRVESADDLSKTGRGAGGFGSTGLR